MFAHACARVYNKRANGAKFAPFFVRFQHFSLFFLFVFYKNTFFRFFFLTFFFFRAILFLYLRGDFIMLYNIWYSRNGILFDKYIETVFADSAESAITDYGCRVYGGGRELCKCISDFGVELYSGYKFFTHYPTSDSIGTRDGITKAVLVDSCFTCPLVFCLKK